MQILKMDKENRHKKLGNLSNDNYDYYSLLHNFNDGQRN